MFGSFFRKSRTRTQINRENARKSTGPRTTAGKAASSRNATKEGFTASFAIVAPEEQQFYDELIAGHRAELRPIGVQEEDLFRRITLAAWNMIRIEKLTSDLYRETGVDPLASDDSAAVARFERYTRHHTLNERSYHRSVKLLRLLQKERAAQTQSEAPEPAQPITNPSETPENSGVKTKPDEMHEMTPQNEPPNQASPDPDLVEPDFDPGPNRLLLIIS